MRFFLIVLLIIFSFGSVFGQRYLFSFHGRIVEDQGKSAFDSVHGYGAYQYEDIINAFKKEKFTVITEYRKPNTDVKEYAHKVVSQIDSLLKKGVKPGNISVIGASKGSLIAMFVSAYLKNKDVNFIFMSACSDYTYEASPELIFYGNVLSIYEKSDAGGRSCEKFKNRSNATIPHYKEIELNTGLKHGYLYKPLPEWLGPATKWAKENYD